ncbi:hypothetical protein M4951_09515 [Blastopirellula sp. J2-11]|uniref:hypothetical protein n=1 Tax=Blastopirellula sp. J2-11 TaxID=2943192 RepID=UPI0021C866A0|nr:hypothetical protein [Blastopirellula sp. J2-11]UUO08541.1 hypothetical protein M4951_09515 [Blastopirellula sp. J2-11]
MSIFQDSPSLLRGAFVCAVLTTAVMGLGCGREASSLNRVTGRVTFKGDPVPVGVIQFTPDTSAGNSGAAGFAEIRDGVYDTTASGRGVIAGAMIVTIDAYSMKNVNPDFLPNGEPLIVGYKERVNVGTDLETELNFVIDPKRR